tara:strand:- start:84 stop:530 length:447 start_codon:yes stop_codon:yes gene_type:complete
MKKILTMITAIFVVGCGDAEAKTSATSEIESTPNIVIVKNTDSINYALYRQAWREVNNHPAPSWAPEHKLSKTVDKGVVELFLDELTFKDAFRLEFLGKGEGHTFWWRGSEYTTDLLDVVHRPTLTTTRINVEEDLREGGGDQGTTGE